MKIAFCFLTYDEIIRYDIWNNFFKDIDKSLYTVYIHPKNIVPYNNYTFNYKIVQNRIKTQRKDDINIVNATLRLLQETLISDINNEISHFIFLTQSCIPLYNFDILYKVITKLPLSLISYIDNNKKERYHQLTDKIKKFINPIYFVKQQPNMILIKDDVKLLIENNLTKHFQHMECPDEHYFVNILTSIFKRNFIKKQTHFCNPDFHKTQAIEFPNVNKDLIDNIRKYGFLFMRKVNKNTTIDNNYLFI